MGTTQQTRDGDAYTIRRYEPGDERGFSKLFGTVWGESRDAEWVRWKYVENPYLDEVPLFVAETDGEVVATRPFVALRMRAGEETPLALLTTDTMVHPGHRRRGLFSRMTERALTEYTAGEPRFVFNQPNPASLGGYEKLGWRTVDPMVTYYRVQRPEAFVDRLDDESIRTAGRVAAPLARGYLAARERLATPGDGVAVTSEDGVAVDRLAALYRRDVPDAIHALRDERYYRWRYASPLWRRRTYVAEIDGEDAAAAIARTRTTHEGVTVTQVADLVPAAVDGRRAAVAAVVERIVDDHRDSDLIAAPGRATPADVLTEYGFHPDDRLPFSKLKSHESTLAVRPLTPDVEAGWRLDGRSLTDPANWHLSFGERDTT